jgi:hypothetical protein
MTARKRIVNAEGEEFALHLDSACACLEQGAWKDALRKDFHLVQAALAADQTILSNEQNFPRLVAIACRTVRVLSTLYYANPVVERDVCRLWITAGAEKDPERRIDLWVENHDTVA